MITKHGIHFRDLVVTVPLPRISDVFVLGKSGKRSFHLKPAGHDQPVGATDMRFDFQLLDRRDDSILIDPFGKNQLKWKLEHIGSTDCAHN